MREMKDSGVEWIGKIPADWQVSRLKYLVSRKTEQAESGAKYIGLENIESFSGNYVESENPDFVAEGASIATAPNDVIFGKLRPYLAKCYIVKETGSCSTEFIVMEPVGVDASFLQLLLLNPSVVSHINMSTYGTKMPRANWEIIGNVLVPYAPKEEQQKIVRYLSSVCSKIDNLLYLNRAQIEELRLYKQSLITETVTRGLDPDAPMKDSGVDWIGAIPTDWTVFPSKYMFHESAERRKPDDEQLTASQKYGIISQEEYMERENARVVMADKGLENWKHVEPNDFVISLRSFQGGLEMSKVKGCVTWHYIVLRAARELEPDYYKWLFKSQLYITALQRTCNYIRDGQDLRYSNFVAVPLCKPPLEEQKKIAAFLDGKISKIDALISLKQSKIEKLTRYRQSLIYEYVTGKKEAP